MSDCLPTPHPLSLSPSKGEREGNFLKGLRPSLKSLPLKREPKRGKASSEVKIFPLLQGRVKERRSLSYTTIPLPLVKGKGIKGIGLLTINGVGLVNNHYYVMVDITLVLLYNLVRHKNE